MRKLSFAVAMFAALATALVPIAPAHAAVSVEVQHKAASQIIKHAEEGNALILTKQQLKNLERTNKSLHSRLMKAYKSNQIPSLSAAEKKELQAATAQNLKGFKAGYYPAPVAIAAASTPVGLYVVIALIAIVLIMAIFGGLSGSPSSTAAARLVRNFGIAMIYPIMALIGVRLALQ